MFNFFSKQPNLDADGRKRLLDEVITPAIAAMGLEKKGDYVWHTSGSAAIRHGLEYTLLKGDQGTLTWGVCLDFVPLASGSSLKLYKTEKAFKFHLFEWTDEYMTSFSGGNMSGGVIHHTDSKRTKEALIKLLGRYIPKAKLWLDTCNNIDQITKTAEQQANTGGGYNLHHPNPKYILPFLYAKQHLETQAVTHFNALDPAYFNNKQELKDKAFKHLMGLL